MNHQISRKQNINYQLQSTNNRQKNSFCYSTNVNHKNIKSKDKYLSVTSAINNSFDCYHNQSNNIKHNQKSRISQGHNTKSNQALRSSNKKFQEKSFLLPQTQTITQMIDLLTQYQRVCQNNMDLPKAEQARKKINQLKKQQLTTRRKQLEQSQTQNVNKTNRQTKQQAKHFNAFWNQKIEQAIATLKELQKQHIEQQLQKLQNFTTQIKNEAVSRVKFSSKVLQIRKNLSSLIKGRKYKQAEHLKHLLQKLQKQQVEKWEISGEQKKKIKIKQFKKKQQIQIQAFRLKLTSSFNELIKQKEKQEIRMLKNIRKKQIESAKIPNYLLRAKTNLLNESKARLNENE